MDHLSESFRKQPPAPLPDRRLNLPTPVVQTLANGLKILVVESNRLPLVSIRLALPRGDASDPNDLPGLTDLLTEMLVEGTESRSSRQIAEEVARYGSTLTAGANSDYTTVAASTLSAYTTEILDLLADIVLRPTFPDDELDLVKVNAQQNLIAQRAQPSFLASEALARIVFGEHPYAIVSPTAESIDAMTRDALREFHASTFVPEGSVLVVVGDVDQEKIFADIDRLLGQWTGSAKPASAFPIPPERDHRAAYIVDRPGSAQSNIVIANLAITRTDPDYFPMLVMHTVLGANASSRLFMNLREEKGYTYGAYTSLDARRCAGTFRATAEVRSPVTGDSLKEFFYEFDRIRNENVDEKELNDAKTYLTGIFPIRLETQDGLIDQLVQLEMYGLPDDYLRLYRERIKAVTSDDVIRVANEYVRSQASAIVIVGDGDSIADQIQPFAEKVELFDSQGRRKVLTSPHSAKSTDATLSPN